MTENVHNMETKMETALEALRRECYAAFQKQMAEEDTIRTTELRIAEAKEQLRSLEATLAEAHTEKEKHHQTVMRLHKRVHEQERDQMRPKV